jgi:HSP20 family protein
MAVMQRDPIDELAHWEPFRGIEALQREMNRLFDRMASSGNGEGRSASFMPSMEMAETEDAILLTVEVPGMESQDLTVEATEESVLIQGERKSESKTEEKGVVRSELHYGRFERRIPLSSPVQVDHVQGECKNGVLKLTLPKAKADEHKAIKVNIS